MDSTPNADPAIRLGPYRVVERVRGGGQAELLRAFDTRNGDYVALKLVRWGLNSSQSRDRLVRELDLLRSLDHPQILATKGMGTEAGSTFLITPWIEGSRIDRWLDDRGSMSIHEVLQTFIGLCDAVQYAHDRNILHLDIKPSNILVDSQGRATLIDFGLGRSIEDDASHLSKRISGHFAGTPIYAAPEQVFEDAPLDVRCDVYSLCMVLYELITGGLPYGRPRDREDWLHNHATPQLPRKPRKSEPLQKTLDPSLESILLQGVDRDRDRRYSTVRELMEDLERYLKGDRVQARRRSRLAYLRHACQRHHRAILLSLLVATASVFLGTRSLVQAERLGRERHGSLEAEKHLQSLISDIQKAKAESRQLGQEARRQADRSRTVRRFLVEDFLAPHADAAPPTSSRLSETLRIEPTLIDRRFGDQPMIRASVHGALARCFNGVGRFDDSRVHAQIAYDVLSERSQLASPPGIDVTIELAASLSEQGKYEQAERYFREGRDRLASVPSTMETSHLRLLRRLTSLMAVLGRWSEAEALCREALELCDRYEFDRSDVEGTLAGVLKSLGRENEALTILKGTIARLEERGEKGTTLAGAYSNLGEHYHSIQAWSEAHDAYRLSLDLHARLHGTESAAFAVVELKLAFVLVVLRSFGQAETRLNHAATILERTVPPGNLTHLFIAKTRAQLFSLTGRLDLAESQYRDLLEPTRRGYGEMSPAYAAAWTNLGRVQYDQEKYAAAATQFKKGIEIYNEIDAAHKGEAPLRTAWADSLYRLGFARLRGAEDELAEEAFSAMLALEVPMPKENAASLGELARLARKQGRLEEAAALLRDAVELSHLPYPEAQEDRCEYSIDLATVLSELGDIDDAEEILTDCLDEDFPGTESFLVRRELGRLWFQAGLLDDAIQMVLDAYEGMRAHWPDRHPQVRNTIELMIELYDRRDPRGEESRAWREKLR